MPGRLVTDRWRPAALVAIVAGLAVAGVLGGMLRHRASTAFDNWALRKIYLHVGFNAASFLLDLSTPGLSFGILVLLALAAAAVRRWDVLLLAVLGPGLAVIATENVLKPIIGRLIGPNVINGSLAGALPGSYPSGHETVVAAAAVALLVAAGQIRLGPPARAAIAMALTLWVLLAAVGLVRGFWHYTTDTIGAVGVSVATVLITALGIDQLLPAAVERVRRRQLT